VRDIIERLMDFENEGITASDRYNLRCEAATTIHSLREELRLRPNGESSDAQPTKD